LSEKLSGKNKRVSQQAPFFFGVFFREVVISYAKNPSSLPKHPIKRMPFYKNTSGFSQLDKQGGGIKKETVSC